MREASLSAWVMKPLLATSGMRERTQNESKIVAAIPTFMNECGSAYCYPIGRSEYGWDESCVCNVRHVRTTGIVESRRCSMFAGSPDALLAAVDEEGGLRNV